MQRNHEYSFESKVRFSEIDHTKKITLPGIINYFQDCTIFHSESMGLGVDYLAKHKKAWVLSFWQVEVLRYPKIAERISIHTWATGFKGILGDRNFCMKDEEGNMVACANSLWVYMDMEKGRPAKPPKEEIDLYGTERSRFRPGWRKGSRLRSKGITLIRMSMSIIASMYRWQWN